MGVFYALMILFLLYVAAGFLEMIGNMINRVSYTGKAGDGFVGCGWVILLLILAFIVFPLLFS